MNKLKADKPHASMVTIQKILTFFNDLNHIVLATMDEKKPRLRPMTLVRMNGGFFFATGTDSNKVKQLTKNPEIEILLQWKEEPNNGYIRIEGTAIRENSTKLITELFHKYEYLHKLWKNPQDPTLIIYRVKPRIFDYMKTGAWKSIQLKY